MQVIIANANNIADSRRGGGGVPSTQKKNLYPRLMITTKYQSSYNVGVWRTRILLAFPIGVKWNTRNTIHDLSHTKTRALHHQANLQPISPSKIRTCTTDQSEGLNHQPKLGCVSPSKLRACMMYHQANWGPSLTVQSKGLYHRPKWGVCLTDQSEGR